jgi:hypothetical protein
VKGFASSWLQEKAIYPKLINEEPHSNTGIIIVIPAYDETGILNVLDSIGKCIKPACETEVLVIVNAPAKASDESLRNNEITVNLLKGRKREQDSFFFRLLFYDTGRSDFKDWGVGMARKTGMDEALRRFSSIGRKDGIIANLDGDCIVDENFLVEIEKEFLYRHERNGCSVFFEHDLKDTVSESKISDAISSYELHLRYYNTALRFIGYPSVHHTVGSSLAVRASAYMKAGGMNRKQAGEDFYFVQKLIPLGGYFNLNTTTVRPSARKSFRVPFGTGAAMSKLSLADQAFCETYDPESFIPLKKFFSYTPELRQGSSINDILTETADSPLKKFLEDNGWSEKILEVRNNTSSPGSFEKRFFEWFNMFRIMKYLNFAHQSGFQKTDSVTAALKMAQMIGEKEFPESLPELLARYRSMERAL